MDRDNNVHQLAEDAKELRRSYANDVDTLAAKLHVLVSKLKPPPFPTSDSKSGRHAISNSDIPTCYGTIELRQALTEARDSMKTSAKFLQETRNHLPGHMGPGDIDSLLYFFNALDSAFRRMMKQMEPIVDIDDVTITL